MALASMYRLILLVHTTTLTLAWHFRGGTIAWKALSSTQVEFKAKLGWTYGMGPGCTEARVGEYIEAPTFGVWDCIDGCGSRITITDVGYTCMAADPDDEWEMGERLFTYTFSWPGPFIVGFEKALWMLLATGQGRGPWRIATTVDLRTRSDTQWPNSSPIGLNSPVYKSQFMCNHTLRIPVTDPDGDTIRCRWAVGDECQSVCNALPGAYLNETSCTLYFTTEILNGFTPGGFYAVAVQLEDYPKDTILLEGGEIKTPTDVLSSSTMQFILKAPTYITLCDEKPVFIFPTPNEGSEVIAWADSVLTIAIVAADISSDIQTIQIIGPTDMFQTELQAHSSYNHTVHKTLLWVTSVSDVGTHLVCASATNALDKTGDLRCFTVKVEINDCVDEPCENGGTCVDLYQGYRCDCSPGYTGQNCSTGVDFCEPENPCQNGGICSNTVTGPSCHCINGWQGDTCDVREPSCSAQGKEGRSRAQRHSSKSHGACCDEMEYGDCQCHISPHVKPKEDKDERRLRDIVCLIIGIPFGLVISLMSFSLFGKFIPDFKPPQQRSPVRREPLPRMVYSARGVVHSRPSTASISQVHLSHAWPPRARNSQARVSESDASRVRLPDESRVRLPDARLACVSDA